MARSVAALALLALAEACSSRSCSACSASQCAATDGCRSISISFGESSEQFCEADCVPGSLACCAGKSLGYSLAAGLACGLAAGYLACFLVGFMTTRFWSQAFLDEGNPEVLRASATVQEIFQQLGGGIGAVKHFVELRFQASDGTFVLGSVPVFEEFWKVVEEGPVDVAYNIQEPRDFVIVENERLRPQLWAKKWSLVQLSLLTVAATEGVLLIEAQTGCPLAEHLFFAMLLAGAAWGRFLWLPLTRHTARSHVMASAAGSPRAMQTV